MTDFDLPTIPLHFRFFNLLTGELVTEMPNTKVGVKGICERLFIIVERDGDSECFTGLDRKKLRCVSNAAGTTRFTFSVLSYFKSFLSKQLSQTDLGWVEFEDGYRLKRNRIPPKLIRIFKGTESVTEELDTARELQEDRRWCGGARSIDSDIIVDLKNTEPKSVIDFGFLVAATKRGESTSKLLHRFTSGPIQFARDLIFNHHRYTEDDFQKIISLIDEMVYEADSGPPDEKGSSTQSQTVCEAFDCLTELRDSCRFFLKYEQDQLTVSALKQLSKLELVRDIVTKFAEELQTELSSAIKSNTKGLEFFPIEVNFGGREGAGDGESEGATMEDA